MLRESTSPMHVPCAHTHVRPMVAPLLCWGADAGRVAASKPPAFPAVAGGSWLVTCYQPGLGSCKIPCCFLVEDPSPTSDG